MKNLLALAIVLSSVSAFATRARVTALGNSPHLIDVAQSSPDQVFGLGDSLTIESGSTAPVGGVTAANQSKYAEGTLYKSLGAGKLGLVLGHQDALVYGLRAAALTAGVTNMKAQQNPLEVSYSMNVADMVGSVGLIYSNFNKKAGVAPAEEKESSMGIRAGISNSLFYGNVKLILADKYEDIPATVEYKGKMGFDLKGGMNFGETLSVHANIVSSGAKVTVASADAADQENMLIAVNVVDAAKKDGNNFFYGVGLSTLTSKEKITDSKTNTLNLPLIIGLEATANSWLTLRASVKQDVLLSNEKTETAGTATTETNPGANTTAYAAGASLAFNKISVDGTITSGGTQNIDGGNLLGTVGLTYNF
jgi:hypothetical protein